MSRRPYAFLTTLALLLMAVLGASLLTPVPARAADNGSWSVFPTASAVAQRPYFYLSADPGTAVEDKVTVANKTDQPLTFRLYAADAYNTARDGGFAVRTLDEKQRGVGAWARPAKSRVTVPPRKSVTVPFTLRVPEGAEPGDHVGALVALDERIAAGDGSLALGVRRAVGARIYLRVSGPAVSAIAVENVRITHDQPLVPGLGDSSATISYTLHNTGNVTLDPRVELRAQGLFGRTLLSRDLTGLPSELLPGQRVSLTEPWHGAPQLDWGDVTLTATAKDTRESASVSFFALPWLMAVLLGVFAAVGTALLIRARRNAPRKGSAPKGRGAVSIGGSAAGRDQPQRRESEPMTSSGTSG
ncbi:WxL protein peptidoglycan domain-containing protein [Streptomyces geranii]|uniref:WxL protein peptidoglycan domain-containing protein n=1 Tax=Streptomyces geranii TaxID=2058923 RepID=UPI0018E516D7|nr:DUF916 domain-containing protein [Streptomyces geranii]